MLEDADTIVTISDGDNGTNNRPVPFMIGDRMQVMERQMKRGCGYVKIHYSTFTADTFAPEILEWCGGYFDFQDDSGKPSHTTTGKRVCFRLCSGTVTTQFVRRALPK